jgi:hypothetical protein
VTRTADAPGSGRTRTTVLPAPEWRALQADHAARADALTASHRRRRLAGTTHPIDDFLYDYYGVRPAALGRWHPGVGACLADDGAVEHLGWRWYGRAREEAGAAVVGLDVGAFLADRRDAVAYIGGLLRATASRPASTGCLGLHEWAMVYRQDDARRRHSLPLRLGRAGTDAVVEAHQIRCTHIDAFRFFTPEALGRNRVQPTRASQSADEQPGCLHANMDCLKWALKLGPAVPGDLLLDCFELAAEIRVLDMQASPYDVSTLGEPAVAIETPVGKAEYVARQRAFAERTAVLRGRLIDVCDRLVAATP